jgi:rhomboid protease GluP
VNSNSLEPVVQPFPRITVLLIVVYAVSMLLEAAVSRMPFNLALNQPSINALTALGANAYDLTIAAGQWWRLLTSTLLHGGITHLGFNSLATWNIVGQLEPRAGWRAVLATFALTGVFASLGSVLINSRDIVGIGASGAIFGMFGFVIVLGVSDVQEFVQQIRRNFVILLLMVGSSAIIPGIDNVAHIGGLLAGLLLGFFWERLPESFKTVLGERL